ncbi:hypothetical protein [uncultured Roseobacter sp.]|uniref:hypothetical protein n=1 Tax=uncultured Roseobacter sp. TaxID=114847 RepID=UPI002614FDED|nr:hypothetical protein [uncultured Roseobacter sp.]
MKYATLLTALVVSTPALAHHEADIGSASPLGLVIGLCIIAAAALLAWRLRGARTAS